MRLASLLLSVALSSTTLAVPAMAQSSYTDAATLDTPFTLQQDTQVPGKLLKAGNYHIVIKDHLSDRAIIQVKSDSGKVESLFLGVFHSGLQSGSIGPIALATEKGHEALRGFKFPGGGTVEFVYPKAEAAALVSKTPEQVLAIDPASDNLNIKNSDLSKEDAQIVTLWALQATKVTAGQQGIAAKHYVAPASTPETTVASVQAPATTPAAPQAVSKPVATKRPAPPATNQVASSARRPTLAALPHTASNMPAVLLVLLGSLGSAFIVRLRRQAIDAR
jgi:hypothetical protein